MALLSPSESPAVVVKEIDLSGTIPSVQSSTGAIIGNFRWGPAKEATLINSEASLAETFGAPDSASAVDFLSAAQFLKYSASLQVVREYTSAAKNATSSGVTVTTVNNRDHWDEIKSTFGADSGDTNIGAFAAKWAGSLGNSLKVSICPFDSDNSDFTGWSYKAEFDGAPGTSSWASARDAANDEIHVIVVDEDGQISGTPGTVLERFPYLSVASDAKTADGSTLYAPDVINNQSKYIWMTNFEFNTNFTNAGTATTKGTVKNYLGDSDLAVVNNSLSGGVNSGTLTSTEIATGVDLFEDKDTITIDFLIAPQCADDGTLDTVVTDMIAGVDTGAVARKDCVVVTSPSRAAIVNNASPAAAAVTTANLLPNSSYLFMDGNFLKVYDKYNDKYRFIPAASTTAGIMAATDINQAPWFSPAGQRRGQYLGAVSLAFNPSKSDRDTLYKAGVNPVANIPGQGILLYGDKTKLQRPSAFDRINVRRLFTVIERAVEQAAKNMLFEFNDEFTRAEFINIVEPFLRDVQGRRGITDFRVICDETNNTPAVIDSNNFIATILIKPARSINFITLNFVATRTGVSFEEVAGQV